MEAQIERVEGQIKVGELPTVEADRSQMRQLLQNLIANALKFHKEGEAPILKVRNVLLRREEAPEGERTGGRVRILVEDNGIGFDEKYLEHVFAPFQRLHRRDASTRGQGWVWRSADRWSSDTAGR